MKKVNVPVTGRHALLSLVVFVFSFIHSVCTIYDHAFGVYIGLKESVIKMCYKRIYYPVYGSLSTINHGNILTGHTRSVMFVLRSEKKKKVCLCLRHSGHSYV